MGALLSLLLKEHGGKTMAGGVLTFGLVVWTLIDTGIMPMPATRDYVDQAIATGTKGLDYLVKQAVERDVDLTAYEVRCMNQTQKQGVLDRLIGEYFTLTGEAYQQKPCDELERRLRGPQ